MKKTKNLTREENNERLSELGKKLATQYNFTIVPSAKRIDAKRDLG